MPVARRRFLSAAAGMLAASHCVEAAAQPRVQGPGRTTLAHLLPPGAESHFVAANGIKLHYVVAGTGPAVVLLHGWPETWFAWAGTIRALSDRFTVVAPDLRGTGLSERTASGYDKLTIASDIAGLIGQTAGGRAHVIAHDMGGKAAYVLARMHPEHICTCLCPWMITTSPVTGVAKDDTFSRRRDTKAETNGGSTPSIPGRVSRSAKGRRRPARACATSFGLLRGLGRLDPSAKRSVIQATLQHQARWSRDASGHREGLSSCSMPGRSGLIPHRLCPVRPRVRRA